MEVLRSFHDTKCSLVHDRIYALRAFANHRSDINVNYSDSTWKILFDLLVIYPGIDAADVLYLAQLLELSEGSQDAEPKMLISIPFSIEDQGEVAMVDLDWEAWNTCAELANEKTIEYCRNNSHAASPDSNEEGEWEFSAAGVDDDLLLVMPTITDGNLSLYLPSIAFSEHPRGSKSTTGLSDDLTTVPTKTDAYIHIKTDDRVRYILGRDGTLYCTCVDTKPGVILWCINGWDAGAILRVHDQSRGRLTLLGFYHGVPEIDTYILDNSKKNFERSRVKGYFDELPVAIQTEALKLLHHHIQAQQTKQGIASCYQGLEADIYSTSTSFYTVGYGTDEILRIQMSVVDLLRYSSWATAAMWQNTKRKWL